MPMKLIILVFLTVLYSGAYAEECIEPTSQESEAVTITPDPDSASGMYHVWAPREFKGMELKLLVLSATMNGTGEGKEISLPLAIKTKGEFTGSYFHMPTNWLNIQVAANYGKDLCAELVANFSM